MFNNTYNINIHPRRVDAVTHGSRAARYGFGGCSVDGLSKQSLKPKLVPSNLDDIGGIYF